MFKRMISACLLAVAMVLPLLTAGCEKDEIKIERQVEVQDMVVDQQTVVE